MKTNYSNETVSFPANSVIVGCNLTGARVSGLNLNFVNCNLNNVTLDPSWVLDNCSNVFFRDVEVDGVMERQIIEE